MDGLGEAADAHDAPFPGSQKASQAQKHVFTALSEGFSKAKHNAFKAPKPTPLMLLMRVRARARARARAGGGGGGRRERGRRQEKERQREGEDKDTGKRRQCQGSRFRALENGGRGPARAARPEI